MEDQHVSRHMRPDTRPTVRYQGAVVRDGAVLLICQREHATNKTYWLLPGGRMEPGETPEVTVARELREETNLIVRVERMLFDVAAEARFGHEREHTYLCTPIGGEADMRKAGLSARSCQYARAILRSALNDANRWGWSGNAMRPS
jgi:ADP-ribose pyrophosphatase YjhB (NUDIX family)